MPRLRRIPRRWVDPELRRCVEVAGKAAGPGSPFTDGEILLLASIGSGRKPFTPAGLLTDENGVHLKIDKDELKAEPARDLAWIMHRDPVGAARVILAARKEQDRIDRTMIWIIRRVLRHEESLRFFLKGKHDLEGISAAVKRHTGTDKGVTPEQIHTAIRLETLSQIHQGPGPA